MSNSKQLMSKKKILILGPISDFGGREVEANIIARSFLQDFQVHLLSTIFISKNSFAIIDSLNYS